MRYPMFRQLGTPGCVSTLLLNEQTYNLVSSESHCVALVQPPFSLVTELAYLLDVQVDIKLKHGALGLLKHLSQSSINRATLGEAGILDKLTKSEIWFETSDMAEIVQLSAIGTAKHLCSANRTFPHHSCRMIFPEHHPS